jgi:CheY-like chemotaxis protein
MNSKINVPKLIDSVLNLFEFRLFKEKIHISKYYDNINVVVRDDESLIKFNLINIFNKILELKICSVSIYNTYNEDKCEIEIIVYNDKSSIENFNLNLKNVTIKIIDNGVHSIVLSIENNLLSLTNSKSIALIDDNYDFSRLMNYMMKDYPIKKFYSKPDLVDIFMSEYDVYLIDFHLGQCFGLELILLLKELDPSARYILVTADKNASIPENIEVIYKPIKKVDIDRIVRESDIVKR